MKTLNILALFLVIFVTIFVLENEASPLQKETNKGVSSTENNLNFHAKMLSFQICTPEWCFADQGQFCCNDGCCSKGMNCCVFNGYQRCTFLNCD